MSNPSGSARLCSRGKYHASFFALIVFTSRFTAFSDSFSFIQAKPMRVAFSETGRCIVD